MWDLDAEHFSERHGLFVIIALGESLIVAGTAVAGDDRTADLVLTAGGLPGGRLPPLVDLLRMAEGGHGGRPSRRYPRTASGRRPATPSASPTSPSIGGIIAVAVAVEEILPPPRASRPTTAVIVSLIVGIGLFIGDLGVRLLADHPADPRPRASSSLAVTLGVVALLAEADPVWPLTAVAVGLLAIVVTEEITVHEETAADVHID